MAAKAGPKSKFNAAARAQIGRMLAEDRSHADIARIFGVDRSTISRLAPRINQESHTPSAIDMSTSEAFYASFTSTIEAWQHLMKLNAQDKMPPWFIRRPVKMAPAPVAIPQPEPEPVKETPPPADIAPPQPAPAPVKPEAEPPLSYLLADDPGPADTPVIPSHDHLVGQAAAAIEDRQVAKSGRITWPANKSLLQQLSDSDLQNIISL
jgi:hypothetical protein